MDTLSPHQNHLFDGRRNDRDVAEAPPAERPGRHIYKAVAVLLRWPPYISDIAFRIRVRHGYCSLWLFTASGCLTMRLDRGCHASDFPARQHELVFKYGQQREVSQRR